jgi:hypothetical protein
VGEISPEPEEYKFLSAEGSNIFLHARMLAQQQQLRELIPVTERRCAVSGIEVAQ